LQQKKKNKEDEEKEKKKKDPQARRWLLLYGWRCGGCLSLCRFVRLRESGVLGLGATVVHKDFRELEEDGAISLMATQMKGLSV
jgi:hypothetical protein